MPFQTNPLHNGAGVAQEQQFDYGQRESMLSVDFVYLYDWLVIVGMGYIKVQKAWTP